MARRQTSTDSNSSNQSESSSASSSCSRVRMRKTFSPRPKSACTASQIQQQQLQLQSQSVTVAANHSATVTTSTVTALASPSNSAVLESRKMSLTTPERRRVSRQKAVNKWTPKEISWPPQIWPVISRNMWHNYLKPSLLHLINCTIFCSFKSLP